MKVSLLLQLLIRKKSLFLSRIMGCPPVSTGKTPPKRGFITLQCHQNGGSEGEMLEWLKRHAWKACIRQKRIRGSNPRLSAGVRRRLRANPTADRGSAKPIPQSEAPTKTLPETNTKN